MSFRSACALNGPPAGLQAQLNSTLPGILGVSVVNAEVNDSGVSGHPGCFPATSVCCVKSPGHKLHGGRRRGRKRDSTGSNGWSWEVGVTDVDGAAVCNPAGDLLPTQFTKIAWENVASSHKF